jgi:predicted dehydrogenase
LDESGIEPVAVGVLGCGVISEAYLTTMRRLGELRVIACADLDADRAASAAERHGIRALTAEEMLSDPGIELVVNLTPATAHLPTNLAVLEAGKHLYSEKALAPSAREARQILDLAEARGLTVACAPDTVLSAPAQAARRLVAEGAIGEPVCSAIQFFSRGPGNAANAAPFYRRGGGPLFDMGPYYLTSLVNMLGPARRVTGSDRVLFPHPAHYEGPPLRIEMPTLSIGAVEFAGGAMVSVVFAWGLQGTLPPGITLFGSEGVLEMPDPNRFDGSPRLRRHDRRDWRELPVRAERRPWDLGNIRGVGVAEMATALRSNRRPAADAATAAHVVDIMAAVVAAGEAGHHIELETTCAPAPPLERGVEEVLAWR